MKDLECECKCYVLITVIFSILAAISETILFILGYFPAITSTLIIALTVALLLLIAVIINISLISQDLSAKEIKCTAKSILKCFVIGVIGTIASIVITLSTHLNNIAQSAIVMVSLSAFSFSLMIISFVIISFLFIENKILKNKI